MQTIFDWMKELIGNIPKPIIFELGCNDGTDSLKMLEVIPKAEIYAFDPDPRIKFKHQDKVKFFPVGVAMITGYKHFYQSNTPYSSSIHKPTGHLIRYPDVKFEPAEPVLCATLDSLYTTHLGFPKIIDFIWADVQGAEKGMIIGGQVAISRTRYLYTEYYSEPMYNGQPTLKQMLKLLPSYWEVFYDFGDNILLQNTRI